MKEIVFKERREEIRSAEGEREAVTANANISDVETS